MTRAADLVRRHPGRCAFVVFFGLAMCWSVITPIYGAPDEPAHILRAESLVRGQLIGTKVPGTGDLRVTVPAFLGDAAHQASCLAFKPVVPASCLHLTSTGHGTREVLTSAGRAPPAYYAVIGLPSLVVPGIAGIWVMRLLNAVLCAALVALAFDTARRYLTGTLAWLGIAVAVTPMLFFLSGIVNPSALEIAAGVALWVAGSALAVSGRDVEPALVDRVGIAAAVLVLCRQLGPLWVPLIAVVLLIVSGVARVQEVWRQRRARAWTGALVVLGVAALAWDFGTGALNTENTNTVGTTLGVLDRLRDSFGATYTRFLEMIGLFGWRDTRAPTLTVLVWTLALGGVVLAFYLLGSRRALLAAGLLTVAIVLVPILLEVPAAPSDGFYWQGRYTLPIAVGLPILAGALIRPGTNWRLRRAGAITAAALGTGLLLAFLEFWRRNAVGTHGYVFFLSGASWHPPVPWWVLLPAAVALIAAWMWLLLIAPTAQTDHPDPTGADGERPAPASVHA
jgi:hypothetical protein